MKKITALILVVTLMVSMCIPVSAAENSIQPYYINTNQASVVMAISDSGEADISIFCSGNSRVTKIQVTTYIEKQVGSSWVRVSNGQTNNQWSATAYTTYLVKDYSCQLSSTGKYRAVAEFTVTGTVAETFTLYFEATYSS